jgi:hypothetical protein
MLLSMINILKIRDFRKICIIVGNNIVIDIKKLGGKYLFGLILLLFA